MINIALAFISGLAIGLWLGTAVNKRPVSSVSPASSSPSPSPVPSFRPEDISQEALQKRRDKYFREHGLTK